MFSRFRLHHVQPVCETVEREVTDSIIPGRWAYIHLPPHGGFRSGQKLSASYATALLRLPAAWCAPYPSSHLFLCVRKHTAPRARLRRWRMSPVSHSCENPERHSLAVCSTWPLRPIRSREDRKVGGRRKGYGWSLTYAAGGCGIRSSARTSLARILHQLYTAIVVKDVANWFGRQSRNYVERLAGNRRRINLIFPVICMIVSVRVSHYSLQWISKQEGGAIAISDR